MSDLTPEALDELDRRATDAISMMGRASIVGSLQFMEAVEPHISDLIEAARERDRLLAALIEARQFISNGIEFGYIAKPQPGTREAKCLPMIDDALERKDGGK